MTTEKKQDDKKTIPEKAEEVIRETGRHIKEAAGRLSGQVHDHTNPPRKQPTDK